MSDAKLKPTRRLVKGKEWELAGTRNFKAEAEREANHIRKTTGASVRVKPYSGGWAIYVRKDYRKKGSRQYGPADTRV